MPGKPGRSGRPCKEDPKPPDKNLNPKHVGQPPKRSFDQMDCCEIELFSINSPSVSVQDVMVPKSSTNVVSLRSKSDRANFFGTVGKSIDMIPNYPLRR